MSNNKYPHPLEDVFGIEQNSTESNIDTEYANVDQSLIPSPTVETLEAHIVPDVKDDDDLATDKKIDEVYDAAMQTFSNQTAYIEIIEPRYAARTAEVAAQYLSIALNAATAKAKIKADRKRTNAAFIPFNNNKNGNITADRNEILRMLTVDTVSKELK